MTTDLREKIAEVLAGHGTELAGGRSAGWYCTGCEWSRPYHVGPARAAADHNEHVAEAILAAIGERVLPEGGLVRSEWRVDYEEIGTYSAEEVRRIARKLQPNADRVAEMAGVAKAPIPIERRSVTSWDDGTTLIGPWLPVDTEDPRRALTEEAP